MHLDSVDSLSKSCELPDVSDVMKTPVDSAKKKHGRKLIAGGLAERLLRIVQREKSEITFWEHKVKKLREAKSGGEYVIHNNFANLQKIFYNVDLSSSLTIQVVSFSNCCSLVVCKCRVLNSKVECSKVECSQQEQREEIEDTKMMTVLFSPCRAKFVGISVGCHIQIHSPWYVCMLILHTVWLKNLVENLIWQFGDGGLQPPKLIMYRTRSLLHAPWKRKRNGIFGLLLASCSK